jgi:hypothetical protein
VSDDGTITTRTVGDVRIVAGCEGKAASVAVSIKPAPVAAVKITGLPPVVYVKMPFRLGVSATDARGQQVQPQDVAWRSSNVSIVGITPAGQATAASVGHARIIAVVDGVEASVGIDVIEPTIPKVVVVPATQPAPPAPANADFSTTAFFSSNSASDAPSVASPMPPADSVGRGRNRLFVGAGVAAVVAIAASIAVANRSRTGVSTPPLDSVVTQTAPETTTRQATTPPTAVPANTVAVQPDRKVTETTPAPSAPSTTVAKPAAVAREADAFKISVSPQAAMRVGETTTLRADVERTAGTGTAPRVAWESSRPAVVRVDPTTGVAIALAEGQTTISATVGGTRTEIPVTVLSAAVSSAAPAQPRAPVVPPQPDPSVRDTRPAAPSAEEVRAKGTDALREAANGMLGALRARNVELVTQLLADGQNADAADMLKTVKDGYGFTVGMAQVNQPQMTERSGTLDYQVNVKWVSAAGPTRTRLVTMRAEAERSGTAWTVVRHRLVSGWR